MTSPSAAAQLAALPEMPLDRLWSLWDQQFPRRPMRVTVTADGLYELDGQHYKSLSGAAKAITGTHWSGPAFFGLKKGR